MKIKIIRILFVLSLVLVSCSPRPSNSCNNDIYEQWESPVVEDIHPPITFGPEESLVIEVGGEKIEVYDLPQIVDIGEAWGNYTSGDFTSPQGTLLEILEQHTFAQKGAILRVKAESLSQKNYYNHVSYIGQENSLVELRVEEVFANYSDRNILTGDILSCKQWDAIIQDAQGELSWYIYTGTNAYHMRPGYSYIIFVKFISTEMIPLQGCGQAVFELSNFRSYELFWTHLSCDRQFFTQIAQQVYEKYAPEILN